MKNKRYFWRLLLCVGILCVCMGTTSVKEREKTALMVSDDEPVWFCDYNGNLGVSPIKGIIYNVINKDYVENKNGLTIRTHQDKTRDPHSGSSEKTFQIIAINRNATPDTRGGYFNAQLTPLSDAQQIDFSINKFYPFGYERILVWALMPKSIEKVEYKTLQQRIDEQLNYYEGIQNPLVCFTLRRSDEYTSANNSVLYVVNGIEIPERVFDALNPIFIRSLNRRTDEETLRKYNRKKAKEVVVIETFTHQEIIAPNVILSTGRGNARFFVNDIEITKDIFLALKPAYFRETQKIRENDENYRYIEGKHPEDNPKTRTLYKAYI